VSTFSPAIAPGDVELECSASICGFSGSVTCWAAASALQGVRTAAQALYARCEGRAALVSMSPGELSLTLVPADASGHVNVRIAIARITPPECSMTGEMTVELPDLAELVNWSRSPQIEN
jgi:hypothetical protein